MEKLSLDQKILLNVNEACEYSGIGHNKMRELLNTPNCPFLVMNGIKKLVKRKQFEKWIETQENI